MRHQWTSCIALAAALAAVASCGGRSTAATQPTPAAFDPTQPDPKALGIADKMIAEIGGAEAWANVKQIRWERKHSLDGKLDGWARHAWDLWNGRHRFENLRVPTYVANQTDPTQEVKWDLAMYDLFNHAKGAVFPESNMQQQAPREDRDEFVKLANDTWKVDAYQLTMIHKLKDPGVKLSFVAEVKDLGGHCKPACNEIKVSFVPEVGTDIYYLDVNTLTNMPEVWQKDQGSGRIAFSIEDWTTVGGLKFPTKLQNVGAPGELITISNVQIGAPDDSLYVPPVF